MRKQRSDNGQKKTLQVTAAFPYRPTEDVSGNFSCRVSFDELGRILNRRQMEAFMRGIADVIAANNGRR